MKQSLSSALAFEERNFQKTEEDKTKKMNISGINPLIKALPVATL
jgi:hypothetical protein